MKISLRNRIINYLKKSGEWVASGHIQQLASKEYKSPQNTGRRCRELVEENILEVKYIKNHAWYKYLKKEKLITTPVIVEHNGERVARMEKITIYA